MASIVPSFLHFPCFTPVSVPKRVLLTAKGDFRRPRPTLPGLCANISASVSFDISVSVLLDISTKVWLLTILQFRAPRWVLLAGASAAGRDGK